MFPLSTVLFPHVRIPLHVFEPRYRALVADCLGGGGRFGVVLISHGSEVGGGDRRFDVGTVAAIEMAHPLPEEHFMVLARGLGRVRALRWLDDDPYPRALVEPWDCPPAQDGAALHRAELTVRRVRALLSELGEGPALVTDDPVGDTPDEVAWRLCALAPVNPLDRQRLLEAPESSERLALLTRLVEAVGDDAHAMLAGG
jgi:Lon protease-like protein